MRFHLENHDPKKAHSFEFADFVHLPCGNFIAFGLSSSKEMMCKYITAIPGQTDQEGFAKSYFEFLNKATSCESTRADLRLPNSWADDFASQQDVIRVCAAAQRDMLLAEREDLLEALRAAIAKATRDTTLPEITQHDLEQLTRAEREALQ